MLSGILGFSGVGICFLGREMMAGFSGTLCPSKFQTTSRTRHNSAGLGRFSWNFVPNRWFNNLIASLYLSPCGEILSRLIIERKTDRLSAPSKYDMIKLHLDNGKNRPSLQKLQLGFSLEEK
jgi:hypothetical protein